MLAAMVTSIRRPHPLPAAALTRLQLSPQGAAGTSPRLAAVVWGLVSAGEEAAGRRGGTRGGLVADVQPLCLTPRPPFLARRLPSFSVLLSPLSPGHIPILFSASLLSGLSVLMGPSFFILSMLGAGGALSLGFWLGFGGSRTPILYTE